ncbi:hypothetical protein HC891_12770 [Candidatus Gracilibacteria bacterium]|nr:hypothetical protein [Candidatus Gracilibacteria bacterium]
MAGFIELIEARHEQTFDTGGQNDIVERAAELPDLIDGRERAGLDQRQDELLDKIRVTLGAIEQCQQLWRRRSANKLTEQRCARFRRQLAKLHKNRVGQLSPGRGDRRFGAIIQQQEQGHLGKCRSERAEHFERGGIGPVNILDREQQRIAPGSAAKERDNQLLQTIVALLRRECGSERALSEL